MDAIIGLVISAVMVALFAAAAKKSQKGAKGAGSENFPFPFDIDDNEDVEMGDGRAVAQIADERVVVEGVRAIPPTIKADKPMQIEKSERGHSFDLEQAVIYNAILTPKYNDNIL